MIGDFAKAAFPWVCMGILLAVYFVVMSKRNKEAEENGEEEKPENYGALGMCMGLCIGVAIGSALDNMGTGMAIGILAGFVGGTCIVKKDK